MNPNRVVLQKDINGTVDTEATPVLPEHRPSSSNVAGICKELFPSFHAAKIVSPKYGVMFVSYDKASGIKEGDYVAVSINGGVPTAVRPIKFGFSPKNILELDLEPNKGDKYFKRLDGDTPWSEDVAEKIGLEPISIKSESGEKVFNVGLNGLKIGHFLTTLFSSRSKLSISPDMITSVSSSIKTITKSFSLLSESKNGKNHKTETSFRNIDNNLIGVVHEIKGDLDLALKSIGVDKISIPTINISSYDFVYIRMVLDLNISDYEINTAIVSHTYKDRKLEIRGKTGNGRNINRTLESRLGLDGNSRKYRSGIATIGEKKRPITYFYGVTISGDIIDFSAGDKKVIVSNEKHIQFGDKSSIVLGKTSIDRQYGITDSHYPVSKDSTDSKVFFGTKVSIQNGDEVTINKRKHDQICINTTMRYEEDSDSGIETLEKRVSPNIQNEFFKRSDTYRSTDQGECAFSMGMYGKSTDLLKMSPDGNGLSVFSNYEGKSSSLIHGINGSVMSTHGDMQVECRNGVVKSDQIVFYGNAQFLDGISAKKELSVSAKTVSISSERSFNIFGQSINVLSDNSIMMRYSKNFSVSSSQAPLVNNEPTQPAAMVFGTNSVQVQGENVVFQGANSIAAMAGNTASFGAKVTSISGLATGA